MARSSARDPYSGVVRQQDGLTVFCSDDWGHSRALVRSEMPLGDALREICWQIDSWPGAWHIDCISTPTTIYRDLQGGRERRASGGRQPDDGTEQYRASEAPETFAQLPEHTMLGKIGRTDLLR